MPLHLLGLGDIFIHFTTKHTFHPISLRAEHFLPTEHHPASLFVPSPSHRHEGDALFCPSEGPCFPPCPGRLLSPSSDDCFVFFLLVSSNTYIVWGETASIHTPQKAIHSRAAGEAQCSACPLHSWMSFVQSSGLESFPSQSQAINERWKKERKCRRVLSFSTICSFYVCL